MANERADKLIVIAGPTAAGKTEYAIEVAKEFDGEIVSCDSMQIYKYMDIGSAKPTAEERAAVPHHMVDIIDPREPFSVAEYKKMATEVIADIRARGKRCVISGGTGLYLEALLYDDMDFGPSPADHEFRRQMHEFLDANGPEALHRKLREADPEAAARIHPNNVKRVIRALEAVNIGGEKLNAFDRERKPAVGMEAVLMCLNRDRAELYERIDKRVDILIERGLIDEIKGLMDMGFTADDIAMKGIGYKELINAFDGCYDIEEAIRLIKRNTRHYAKRQLNWFRRYDEMKWFNASYYADKGSLLEDMYAWIRQNM